MIETLGLCQHVGKTVAVEYVTSTIEARQESGFLAHNGVEATIIARMLAGMIRPTGGYAVIAGCRIDWNADQLHLINSCSSGGYWHRKLRFAAVRPFREQSIVGQR
jgi:ABC-type Na+ transport system ATPase subunit NatA